MSQKSWSAVLTQCCHTEILFADIFLHWLPLSAGHSRLTPAKKNSTKLDITQISLHTKTQLIEALILV